MWFKQIIFISIGNKLVITKFNKKIKDKYHTGKIMLTISIYLINYNSKTI